LAVPLCTLSCNNCLALLLHTLNVTLASPHSTHRKSSRARSFVPPDGKFKIASFVVSPSACHRRGTCIHTHTLFSKHIHFDIRCVSKKCNVLCCSVQLPIYVKPQITCDGNTAQVNIMVGGSAAFPFDAKQVYHSLVSHFSGWAQTAAGQLFLARRRWPWFGRGGRRCFEGEKNGGGCGCDYSCQNCANDKYAAPVTR
jgi:hypothetical protein